MPTIQVKHPLLRALREFDDEAAKRYPTSFGAGLPHMSLQLNTRLAYGGYWCTPMNSLSFGNTGGDGVHFSFIVIDNAITEDSPVIVTCPMEISLRSEVVADNLLNFLRTGLTGGFGIHEALSTFLHTGTHPSAGDRLSEEAAQVRDFLAGRFGITPLDYTLDEQRALQARYEPLLVYPPDLDEA